MYRRTVFRLRRRRFKRFREAGAAFRFTVFAAGTLIIFISAVHIFNVLLTEGVREAALAEAVNTATEIINSTVNDLISEEGISYSEIMNLRYNEKGEVTSAEADTVLLNRLMASLSRIIVEKFSYDERLEISIPIGSIMKSEIFSGRGPDIHIRIKKAGDVITSTSSSFTDAGINQTCHSIFLNVTAAFTVLLPAGAERVSVSTSVIIAETLIIGNVPSAYIASVGGVTPDFSG